MKSIVSKASLALVATLLAAALAPTCAFADSGTMRGDLNNNGVVNIVDAQIAYDLGIGLHKDVLNYDALYTAADINGDSIVDAADAHAIQYYLYYGTFDDPIYSMAGLAIGTYSYSPTTITVTFTYTNKRSVPSSAEKDYEMVAHQDGYLLGYQLSQLYGGPSEEFYEEVQPRQSVTFTCSWSMKTANDVIMSVTPLAGSKGDAAEKTLTVSGHSATKPSERNGLSISSHAFSGSTLTVTFTYTNKRDVDSCAANDYIFSAVQGDNSLVQAEIDASSDYYAYVQPGYSTTFSISWTERSYDEINVLGLPTAGSGGTTISQYYDAF